MYLVQYQVDSSNETPTELIITFEKYGSGWGEELLPRASIVQRPIAKKERFRNRSGYADPWAVCFSLAAKRCIGASSTVYA